jgi:hypothetical protein
MKNQEPDLRTLERDTLIAYIVVPIFIFITLFLSACGTLGNSATDVVLTGAGGYIGYEASGKKIGGAGIGAAGGYLASKFLQNEYTQQLTEAEQYGYDRALHQAVKQQYWIIQNLQKQDARSDATGARLVTVTLPETLTADGTVLQPTTATIRTE